MPSGAARTILIVEDNSADVYLIRTAIDAAGIEGQIHVVRDGEQAIQFFDDADKNEAAACPSLVILDINLPRKQGGEVLRHLRNSHRCAEAKVIVVSTSGSDRDRNEMISLGANGYFQKPSDYEGFLKLGNIVSEMLDGGSLPS